MKNISIYFFLISSNVPLFGQGDLVQNYQQVMQQFLSRECMSFDMSSAKYGDLEGHHLIENLALRKTIIEMTQWALMIN